MDSDRIALALSQIKPSAWADFEEFASEFLLEDFPNLRTMARASGDAGRDAEVYDLTGDGSMKLQYSVTVSWQSKIRKTVNRIKGTGAKLTHLIYATNQLIGAEADSTKKSIFDDFGVVVDIRDSTYFIERRHRSPSTREASELLARKFVDPLLRARGIGEEVALVLTRDEERLAFLHLTLDLAERQADRNLTKAAFESLVLAVLHNTNHESAVVRDTIVERISGIVGDGAPGQVTAHIENALQRLSASKNGKIKHIRVCDTFHMAHSECQRVVKQSEHFLAQEQYFERDILAAIYGMSEDLDGDEVRTGETVRAIRGFIESILLDYGEKFTLYLRSGSSDAAENELEGRLSQAAFSTYLPNHQVAEAVAQVFEMGSDETKAHLRRLLDSYTVFALLRATPDVQSVLKKIFTVGQIWVDTSFLLPVIAESFGGGSGSLRELVEVCSVVGIELFVTDGVAQEIESHVYSCLAAVRSPNEPGRTSPYLLSEYIVTGNGPKAFAAWAEDLRGKVDPVQDIKDYLAAEMSIKVCDLPSEVEKTDPEIREAATTYWQEITERRRTGADTFNLSKLAAHDVENTLGVMQLRGGSDISTVGHRHWLLTLDNAARGLAPYLTAQLGSTFATPVISPLYLTQLVRFRPSVIDEVKRKLDRVPIMLNLIRVSGVPGEIIEEVEKIRAEIPGIKPRRMQRMIRDIMNEKRAGAEFQDVTESPLPLTESKHRTIL